MKELLEVKKPPAKRYADVNERMGKEYYDYVNHNISFSSMDPYQVKKKIGRGRYSEVFEGTNTNNGVTCVIKVLKPVRYKKVKREIKILENLSGGPQIIQLYDIVQDPCSKTTSLVRKTLFKID